MATPAPSRSDVLRGRIRDLDALETKVKAVPAGPSEPALQAQQKGLLGRIEPARTAAKQELATRDKLDRIRQDAQGIREKARGEQDRIARADSEMARIKGKYPPGTKRGEVDPADLAAYGKAKAARADAEQKLGGLKKDFAAKKAQGMKLKKELDDKAQAAAAGGTGDPTDPCVACVETEASKLEKEAKKRQEEKLALARSLVKKGGSGTDADKEIVAQELAKMPQDALEQLKRQGTTVVACRDSVTDYDATLKGKTPRGWEGTGKTWDDVPGLYDPNKNEVLIATRGHGTPAGAHVPETGDGHSSANLVFHETYHGLDKGGGGVDRSSSSAFTNARTPDVSALTPYEKQAGTAGLEETYAESAARYYGGGGGTSASHLDSYWRSHTYSPPATAPAAGGGGRGSGGT